MSIVLLVWLVVMTAFTLLYKPATMGRKVAYLTVASFVMLALTLSLVLFGPSDHIPTADQETTRATYHNSTSGVTYHNLPPSATYHNPTRERGTKSLTCLISRSRVGLGCSAQQRVESQFVAHQQSPPSCCRGATHHNSTSGATYLNLPPSATYHNPTRERGTKSLMCLIPRSRVGLGCSPQHVEPGCSALHQPPPRSGGVA